MVSWDNMMNLIFFFRKQFFVHLSYLNSNLCIWDYKSNVENVSVLKNEFILFVYIYAVKKLLPVGL